MKMKKQSMNINIMVFPGKDGSKPESIFLGRLQVDKSSSPVQAANYQGQPDYYGSFAYS